MTDATVPENLRTECTRLNALTVTFDTNTLASVVSPENAQRCTGQSGASVRDAIQAGRLRGFFSESLITREGMLGQERSEVLGETRVFTDVSVNDNDNGGTSIGFYLAVGMKSVRPPLNSIFEERIQKALALGMCSLWTPARIGQEHLDPAKYPPYKYVDGMPEFLRYMEDVNELGSEISRRGLGQAVAVEIGKRLAKQYGVEEPELWLQSLGRATDKSDKAKIAKAIAEWSDGDSIAAHYGFGIQLFCSEDFGENADGPSILDYENRTWLTSDFGIEFVTLAELARILTE
jgi:hypothetical protein